jgi:hypothetical protein
MQPFDQDVFTFEKLDEMWPQVMPIAKYALFDRHTFVIHSSRKHLIFFLQRSPGGTGTTMRNPPAVALAFSKAAGRK